MLLCPKQTILWRRLHATKEGDHMPASRSLPLTVSLVAVSLILVATFVPVFYSFYAANNHDYVGHYSFAIAIEDGWRLSIPHILYHILLILAKNTLGLEDIKEVAVTLQTAFRILIGLSLFMALKTQMGSQLTDALAAIVVLLLMWAAPIYLWFKPPLFLGYINYLPYHNPTQPLMLIFTVPMSLIAWRAVSPQPFTSLNRRIFLMLLSVLIVLLLSLSKPSYSIALLPALGLVVLYRLIRRLPLDWMLLIVGIGVPVLLMLALQYLVTYTDMQRASIGIGWLKFLRVYGFGDSLVFARLALSMVFPVTAYALHFREARRDDYLSLSWLVFAVSLIWAYLFYEQGQRVGDGNFVWSAYAALFVLMFSTVLFLVKQYATQPFKLSWRLGLSIAAFLLHFGSGIYAAVRVAAAI